MRALCVVGLVAFAVSWFVPVHEALSARDDIAAVVGVRASDLPRDSALGPIGYGGPQGWRACRVAWDLLTSESKGDGLKQRLLGLTCLTNLVMLAAVLAMAARSDQLPTLGLALLLCAALDAGWLYWTDSAERSGLKVGYWMWMLSFGVVGVSLLGSAGGPSRRRVVD